MAELLLELFSEEIPANLQSSARVELLENFKKFFEKENINFKGDAKVFSTPVSNSIKSSSFISLSSKMYLSV